MLLRPAALTLLLGLALNASAAPLTAQQTLNQFNLVTLGNANISSHVDGRSFIGGGLNGSGAVFAMHPADMPNSSYAGLTVVGNASGLNVDAAGATVLGSLSNANINNGPVVVGGNASNSNFNGSGGSYVYGSQSGVNTNSGQLSQTSADAAVATAGATNFGTVLNGLSDSLATQASTGSWWEVAGGRVTFHAVANSSGVAVFDLTAVDDVLLGKSEFMFDFGGASTVLINSDVSSATVNANFLTYPGTSGSIGSQIGGKTIWNFYNAQSLTLNTQFSGAVLATEATLTNANNIEGGVYVNQIDQRGEIHLQAFSGNLNSLSSFSSTSVSAVPEPGTWGLMLAGLGAVVAVGRRRRQAGAQR